MAIVTKRYNDSEKLELTEQFKENIFVFEAIARAGRERDRENKYIFFKFISFFLMENICFRNDSGATGTTPPGFAFP